MTEIPGSNPFSGLSGFKPADMLDRMWEMMRLSPFGAGIGGATPGLPPSLSAMSDMMAPLSSVEELDKRITDLRAVEQWLKLNLGMLQSAIQALEVQRATLRAFGTLAQTSMAAAEAAVASDAQASRASAGAAPKSGGFGSAGSNASAPEPAAASAASPDAGGVPGAEAFDPAGWWNLLQSQFNQLASFAMNPPAAAAAPGAAPSGSGAAGAAAPAASEAPAEPPRARRPATRRAAPAPARSLPAPVDPAGPPAAAEPVSPRPARKRGA